MLTLQVHLFARFRDVFGTDVVNINLPEPATVKELRAAVASRKAEISGLLARSQVAVNRELAGDETAICAGDEIALIPPVSGG
jgi:molybdopterin converting factor subunit 1